MHPIRSEHVPGYMELSRGAGESTRLKGPDHGLLHTQVRNVTLQCLESDVSNRQNPLGTMREAGGIMRLWKSLDLWELLYYI